MAVMIAFIAKYYNSIKTILNDCWYLIAKITGWGKRVSIQGDIQLIANKSISDLNNIVPELQMPDLEIEWVKADEDGQVRFDKNKAIVMLKFNEDRTQNVINSTSAYIHNTLLTTSRVYMDEPIVKAIDYTIIHKFLQNTPQKRFALRTFVETNRSEISQYQDSFDKVNKIDKEGLLTQILLREYTTWGDSIITELPSEEHKIESREVLDFIYDIASRGYDELTPLQLQKNNVKIAVLLVAKTETYREKGSRPYLRRIREGFTSGINTFYLLARGEKINILKSVYGELIQTGNFTCVNNPSIFKDAQGRENICYCLQIDENGDMASDYADVNNAIDNSTEVELYIEHVYRDELKCLYNGRLQVIVPVEEICDTHILLRNYYANGMTITAIPISIEEGGIIKASLKNTKSNPQQLIDSEYAVGNTVRAIVQEAEDTFVRFLISGSDKQAYAYRRDLTYSNYLFLHELFPIGTEVECRIEEIDYVSNRLRLSRKDLVDPWQSCNIKVGDIINATIYEVEDTYFASEINEGLKIILPYSELSWLDSEIEDKRRRIKRNTELELTIKSVDVNRRIIIATYRQSENPYLYFFASLDDNKLAEVYLVRCDDRGIIGTIGELRVFIPISETHIANNYFNYKIGQAYNVCIKEVSRDGRSLIGSFIPFIDHPLLAFSKEFSEGDTIAKKTIYRADQFLYLLRLTSKLFENCRLCLHISEVSNIAYISEFARINTLIEKAPLLIKKIDYERNRVELSLKSLLLANNDTRKDMDYDSEYTGVIIGSKEGRYIIVIQDYWIEGYLLSSRSHHIGEEIVVYLTTQGNEYAEFYEG